MSLALGTIRLVRLTIAKKVTLKAEGASKANAIPEICEVAAIPDDVKISA